MTTTKRADVQARQGWRSWLGGFFSSSIGLKWLMALTGIGLLLYVLAHMIGNLKIFLGASPAGEYEIDLYGEALRSLGGDLVPHGSVLWLFRIGLIAMFAIHIYAAAELTRRNLRARGRGRYEAKRNFEAVNYANRTMRWGGVIILLFVLYHIADLTLGWVNPSFVQGAVYDNMVASLTRPAIAVLYLVAQLALAFHIYHGAWSLFQSLGTSNERYNSFRRFFAVAFAAVIFLGNTSIVLAIWSGYIS
ncbi:MAG: succinate dehydrogenase cytochrome b subunit [Actinomycetia bacterium]|nr:succinate dehydrogenase cytochrome b subunit [Actinomycetes bacterium]